jgi:phosphoribosylanthranilate isomerase
VVIKAFPAGDRTISRFEEFGADYLLSTAPTRVRARSSTGDWPKGGRSDRIIVSGGLRPDNVAQAVAHLRPAASTWPRGSRSSPGRKDPLLKVRDFIVNARAAETEVDARDPLDEDRWSRRAL